VRALGQIVSTSSGPDENVVGKMTCNAMSVFYRRRQRAPKQGNVFVIPGVPIGNCRAVSDSSDLITICKRK
jgi:hypothetical protein